MSLLPPEISTGKVTGRFIVGVIDGLDPDEDPDVIPAAGKVTFKAAISYAPSPETSLGPATFMLGPITGILDEEGYLCTPYPEGHEQAGWPMYRGVKLIATDDPDLLVTDWTWSADVQLDRVGTTKFIIPVFDFALPEGSEKDLATLVKVPSSAGYGLPQAEAAAIRAEQFASEARPDADAATASAGEALLVANGVRADADAGEFDGLSAYEVWLGLGNTGTEADFINWLKGAKGDPGGLVMGTLIPDSADLQTYVTPGLYRKAGGTVINGPADLQQPYFSMMVIASEPGRVQQIIWPGATGQYGKLFWTNAKAGTTWAGWRATVTMRFDKIVGTAVYAWDSAANADRLIAGETDVYTIAPIGGFTGKITIQRSGNVVTVNVDNLIDTAATSTHFVALPTGFRPPADNDSVGLLLSGTAMRQVFRSGSNLRLATRSGTVAGSLSFITKDPWPSATPPIV